MKNKIFIIILSLLFLISPAFAKEKIVYKQKDQGILVFKINTKKYGDKIKPYMPKNLMTTKKVYDDNCYDFVVNAGFFNVKNGRTVSSVTINNKVEGSIENYPDIVSSLKKENRYEKVLSRAELRILEKNNKLKFDIDYHNNPLPKKYKGYTIKHSLQAGPMLYPKMDLESEGFVVYKNGKIVQQSADILKRRERTAIGLKGKWLYIVVFTKDHKVDANEMRDYMRKNLHLKKILAFDGGLSTSLNYKDVSVGSLGKYQRRVKSFLVIER